MANSPEMEFADRSGAHERLAALAWLAGIGLVVLLTITYGIHLARNYAEIKDWLRTREAVQVRPYVNRESISEIGYIYSMRRETYIREGYLNLVWFVAVPSSGKRYSCSYEAGFSQFEVGDGVTIIHRRPDVDDPEEESDFIIGLHYRKKGKSAEVGAVDEDDLEAFSAEDD
jgi:hypothetical protein